MFKSLSGLKQTPRSKNKVEIKYKQPQTKSEIYKQSRKLIRPKLQITNGCETRPSPNNLQ